MSDKKRRQRKRVCIACGGSAGHIFPGLSLAQEIEKRYGSGVEISFLSSDNDLAGSLLKESGFRFYPLPTQGLQHRTLRESLTFAARLFRGSLESMKIMLAQRPDCFVGFGSYSAGPPFVMASLLGIPTLIHEQNVITGRANNIMRLFATKVALSFPGNAEKKENTVLTGNPIRGAASQGHDKALAREALGLHGDRFTITVIGGSQGSRAINALMAEAVQKMTVPMRDSVQIIHISGDDDSEKLKKAYQDAGVVNTVYPFFSEIGLIYSAADIAVSRAGASAICELAAHRIPAVLIPYPYAGGHQLHNARFFEERGAAVLLKERGLSAEMLLAQLARLLGDEGLRKSMAEKIGGLAVFDAGRRLADEVDLILCEP